VVQIFNRLLRREVGEAHPTVDYVAMQKPEILTDLCRGCGLRLGCANGGA
jgi:hypothetical protein